MSDSTTGVHMEDQAQEWGTWEELIAQYKADSEALGVRIAVKQEEVSKPCHDYDKKCRELAALYKQRAQMGRDIIAMQCHLDGKIPPKWVHSPLAYDDN